jgi:hypothetical protein
MNPSTHHKKHFCFYENSSWGGQLGFCTKKKLHDWRRQKNARYCFL